MVCGCFQVLQLTIKKRGDYTLLPEEIDEKVTLLKLKKCSLVVLLYHITMTLAQQRASSVPMIATFLRKMAEKQNFR